MLSVSAVLALSYFSQIDRPFLEERLTLHRRITQGIAPIPYRYRVLAPHVVGLLADALFPLIAFTSPDRAAVDMSVAERAFLTAYLVFDFAAIFFALSTLFVFLAEWFSRDQSLVGTLFAAATMPVAFRDHYFHPWSLLEIGLFSSGLYLIHRKRYGALALLRSQSQRQPSTRSFARPNVPHHRAA